MGRRTVRLAATTTSHSHQHSAQGGSGSDRYRRIEIITGSERRRRWPPEDKARITAESFAPGVSVSEVARRHGVSLGLLHYWRRRARERGCAEAVHFVPITVTGECAETIPAQSVVRGTIEIAVGGFRIVLSGPVDRGALRMVLAAVREEV